MITSWKRYITNDISPSVLSSTHWYLTFLSWLHRKVFLWTPVTFILPNAIFNTLFSFYFTCHKYSARLTCCFIFSLPLVVLTQSRFLLYHLLLVCLLGLSLFPWMSSKSWLPPVMFTLYTCLIDDLNQLHDFMSIWHVSDSPFHSFSPISNGLPA